MRITDLLSKEAIELNVEAKDKNDIIDKMTQLMKKTGRINNLEEYKNLVLKREEEGSTGVGEGIAIPHGKGDCVNEPGLVAMVVPNGVEYDALASEAAPAESTASAETEAAETEAATEAAETEAESTEAAE